MTRTGLAFVLAVFSMAAVLAADERDRESLRDLDGVRVAVEDLSLGSPVKGISDELLRKDVEAKLRQAGIPVLNQGEYPVGDPYLRVRVSTTKNSGGLAGYDVQVDFVQIVFMRRNPTVTFNRAETWRATSRLGLAPSSRLTEAIQKELAAQVDQFIAAYRAVNPK